MDEKMTDAERDFDEWWATLRSSTGIEPIGYALAKTAYLAATERTARRCMEICSQLIDVPHGDGTHTAMYVYVGNKECANAIAKEFGLELA